MNRTLESGFVPHVGLLLFLVPVIYLLSAGCGVAGPSSVAFPDVVDALGCKDQALVGSSGAGPRIQACIAYEYDGVSVLQLTHVNTAFNCAAAGGVAGGHVVVTPGRISIREDEHYPVPADCLCLFDVSYRLHSVVPGVYRVVVFELYLRDGNEPFDFELDLTHEASGEVCLARQGYPWGYPRPQGA